MKPFTKYFLFLLAFISISEANITPLKSSCDLRSSEYGARYYDPRTSVWQNPDPILDEYMSGEINGGVFNPKNLSLFTYTHNNPVNLVDPDGNNPKLVGDFALNLAIAYATEGKLTWSAVRGAAVDTVKDAVNPMATVNKVKKLVKIARGGAHGKVKGVPGNESHHMPANSVSPLSKDKGPAISMEKKDHKETASWGSSKQAKVYRQKQKKLIDKGKFKEAQQMDIDDVKSKFGSKYDSQIKEMEAYTKTLDVGDK